MIDSLPKLPHVLPGKEESGAGRGLFWVSDYEVRSSEVFDTAKGPRVVMLADGKVDQWVRGRDGITGIEGERNQNKGNYGVMYHIKLKYKSTDGRGVAVVVTNPRNGAGPWCGPSAAAVRVDGKTVRLPEKTAMVKGLPDGVVVGKWGGKGGEIAVTFSPPGASCLPVPLVLVPYVE